MKSSGRLVVDNDGEHATQARDSNVVTLSHRAVPLRLSYFQGPREKIALRMFSKGPGVSSFTIVPQSMLRVGP